MTLQDLQNQALSLPIGDRWRLVQSLLISIQQETLSSNSQHLSIKPAVDLDPWTQSLMGVIQISAEDPAESHVDYLEEKYS
jgi:hypothetical protein